MDIQPLLQATIQLKSSDLHLLVGIPPSVRLDGDLIAIPNTPVITPQDMEKMVFSMVNATQKEALLANKELDFSFGFGGGSYGSLGRFRINVYYQRGYLAAALRFLAPNIKSLDDLKLPQVLHSFASLKQGLVLVCGPTGHGKSTTLAAVINEVNQTRAEHILTIEDPIEYIYPAGKSIFSQREIGTDTHSWPLALKSALREDPDVVLVGEMRDPETMAAAITIAETGHLVFSTLHTNSASQSLDRIIDSFPSFQQPQIRIQLASTVKGIVSQRLLPQIGGGRVAAVEVLIGTSAIASNIRDGKTHLIDSIIQTSQDVGMITLETSLAGLVKEGAITLDTARTYSLHPDELTSLIG